MKAKITEDNRLVIHPETKEEWMAASNFVYKRCHTKDAQIDKPYYEAFYVEFEKEKNEKEEELSR